jgi:hypothetical protein
MVKQNAVLGTKIAELKVQSKQIEEQINRKYDNLNK